MNVSGDMSIPVWADEVIQEEAAKWCWIGGLAQHGLRVSAELLRSPFCSSSISAHSDLATNGDTAPKRRTSSCRRRLYEQSLYSLSGQDQPRGDRQQE